MSASTRRRSITKTHDRIKELGWEPDYHQPVVKFPTRYKFPKNAKDPMKHIMREYLPMELEKDDRVYGGHDAAVRADMPTKANERWLEILKPYVGFTAYAEVGAGRAMAMLCDAVPSNELRNGYHVQFVDEVRHTGMQMSLARWYNKHVSDPEGWNYTQRNIPRDPITNAGINFVSQFIVGDPIQCAFILQIVAETAFTNMAFVALPDIGARNGDFALPTTYLSVQSDEARHISNGYATLMTVLQHEDNIPLIENDLQHAWWCNHSFIDPFVGVIMEYFTKDRTDPESFLTKWDRWVRDDWYRAYVLKLGKLGLDVSPDIFVRARERLTKGLHHKQMLFGAASWPLHFWRFDPMTQTDFDWFEKHYPGWYDEYGMFWEAYAELQDPGEGYLLLKPFLEEAPPLCWTCQTPAVIDEDVCHRIVDDRTRFYCSTECRWMDVSNPGRYTGDRNFFDRYHGWELSEVVKDLGFVRADGRTLLAQPHLKQEKMWTLDDLRACEVTITSPNIALAERMGLPSGDWSTHPLATAGIFYSSTNGLMNLGGQQNGSGRNGANGKADGNGTIATA